MEGNYVGFLDLLKMDGTLIETLLKVLLQEFARPSLVKDELASTTMLEIMANQCRLAALNQDRSAFVDHLNYRDLQGTLAPGSKYFIIDNDEEEERTENIFMFKILRRVGRDIDEDL